MTTTDGGDRVDDQQQDVEHVDQATEQAEVAGAQDAGHDEDIFDDELSAEMAASMLFCGVQEVRSMMINGQDTERRSVTVVVDAVVLDPEDRAAPAAAPKESQLVAMAFDTRVPHSVNTAKKMIQGLQAFVDQAEALERGVVLANRPMVSRTRAKRSNKRRR